MNAKMNDNDSKNKRKRYSRVLVDPDGTKDIDIDEEDYRAISEILPDSKPKEVQDIASIDEEQRVDCLYLQHSNITSLSPSIGRLQNLKCLILTDTKELGNLPGEIGDLVSLDQLDLSYSQITAIPPSIGRLKNLKCLNLCDTKELGNLPEEIGDLVSLNQLNLSYSNITSIPPSIGRLKNLEGLNLSGTDELGYLPEEIGDLVSLIELYLSFSKITSLPPSFGRLKNLEYLNLFYTKELGNFSKVIGDLVSLNWLDLRYSKITSLPPSIVRLKNLGYLELTDALSRSPVAMKIYYEMGRSISRSRIRLGDADHNFVAIPSKLWPLVLHNATRAFQPFRYSRILNLKKTDILYQLLVDGRESFLAVLANREKFTQ